MSQDRRKIIYGIISLCIIVIILALSVHYLNNEQITNKVSSNIVEEIPNGFSLEDDSLKIFFFDVGQGDSSLIINKGKTMLIDAGEDKNGRLLVDYLKKLGISKIDYLIGTHAHQDHIGGLDKIIKEFDIEHIYMPYVGEDNKSKDYMEILEEADNKGMAIANPEIGDIFYIGDVKCIIKYVDNKEPSNINLSSMVIQITLDEQDYLFMGDAEKKIENLGKEQNVIWEEVEVLKVGHHGSDTSSSENFIQIISPDIAIISCRKK